MFVVAGLHTKRRPSTAIIKSSQGIERPRAAKAKLLRDPQPIHSGYMSSFSSHIAPRAPQPRMTHIDHDRGTCNQDEASRRLPIKLLLGRSAPTRVRKFIPKPLILVERMKSRQLLLEFSSPFASGALPEFDCRTVALAPPLPTHTTPTRTRKLPYGTLSSVSHSSSSVSRSSQNAAVFGNGFGQMRPRSRRRLSTATLGDSSASTDTFVADSPCFSKRASKFTAQVTEITTANIHLNVDHRKKRSVGIGVSLCFDSDLVVSDLVHDTGYSSVIFEPGITSTPFGSTRADTSRTLSLMQLVPTAYPSHGWEQTFGADTSLLVASPTSRPIYPSNGHKGAYVVKLPRSRSTGSPLIPSYPTPTQRDAPLMLFVDQPKSALDFKRPLIRVASPPPTLVLDGVFALPRAPTPPLSPAPSKTSNVLPRPHKPALRRPSNVSKAVPVAHHPLQPVPVDVLLSSPTACGGQPSSESHPGPEPESPRSKLAHVLTAHVHTPTTTRKPRRIPPPAVTVMEAQVPNCPRVEALRIRKKAGLARGNVNASNSEGSDDKEEEDAPGGRGAVERVACAGIGMVARLRARWERGIVEP